MAEKLSLRPVEQPELPKYQRHRSGLWYADTSPKPGDSGQTDSTGGLWVYGLPWSGTPERLDERYHLALVSRGLGARAVAVAYPSLSREDFSPGPKAVLAQSAQRQWEVLNDLELPQRISLFAYSMGVTSKAALAAETRDGRQIDAIVLWEAVGSKDQRLATLGTSFVRDGLKVSRYTADNPDWYKDAARASHSARRILAEPMSHLRQARLLTVASVAENLEKAQENGAIHKGTRILVVSGTESTVSSPADNDALCSDLEGRLDGDVRRVEIDGVAHSMYDGINHFNAGLEVIKKSLTA